MLPAIPSFVAQRADERAAQTRLDRQREVTKRERLWIFHRADRIRHQLRQGWSFDDIATGGITLEQVKRIWATETGEEIGE